MFTTAPTFRRITTALCIAVSAAATLPAMTLAQPNNGGSAGDSAYCMTLKDRASAYNDLAHDPRQPKSVRDFYASRAAIVLLHAREAGCNWSAAQAGPQGPMATPGGELATTANATAPARSARTAKARKSFGSVKRVRASTSARRAGSATHGSRPTAPNTVAKVKANPSGNGNLDNYCSQVADLISDAERQGDDALTAGDPQGASEWFELADYMTYTATQNGCRFTIGLHAGQSQGTATQAAVATT
jgi:hypothetical protein